MLPTRNFTTHFRRPEAIDISAATTPSTVVDIFTGVWKKFLITLNQRRVDRRKEPNHLLIPHRDQPLPGEQLK